MTFLERKRKIKQRRKFIFGRKRKKPKMTKLPIFVSENENEFRSDFSLMAWPEWPWPHQILQQIYATGGWHKNYDDRLPDALRSTFVDCTRTGQTDRQTDGWQQCVIIILLCECVVVNCFRLDNYDNATDGQTDGCTENVNQCIRMNFDESRRVIDVAHHFIARQHDDSAIMICHFCLSVRPSTTQGFLVGVHRIFAQ